jgi:HK97 family phage prohead protease
MNRLSFDFEVKGKKDGTIVIAGYANANTIDRGMERIDPSAWNLDNYKKNPVVLFDHGKDPAFGNLPIGKSRVVEARDGGLYCEVEISNSKTERITAIRDLVEEGILKTFSVGFDPKSATKDGEVSVIDNAELIEISAVPLPMNQDSTFALLSKMLPENRTKTAKRWFDNYKKNYQKEIIREVTAKLNCGKLEFTRIVVTKSDGFKTSLHAAKFLKEHGHSVEVCTEKDDSFSFEQCKYKGEEIGIKIHPEIEIFIKGETMDKDENACGKKPRKKEDESEDSKATIIEPGMDEEKPIDEEKPKEDLPPAETPSEDKPKEDEEKPKEDEETDKGEGASPSWVADSDAWSKAKEAAGQSYSKEDAENYWSLVTWLYLNEFGGTRKEPSATEGKSTEADSKKTGETIPTGANAVKLDTNPMLDLQKQTNVLVAGVISELQKLYGLLEKNQLPEREETPTELPPETQPILPEASLAIDENNQEIQKCIEKIKKTQQDLTMRLKKLS